MIPTREKLINTLLYDSEVNMSVDDAEKLADFILSLHPEETITPPVTTEEGTLSIPIPQIQDVSIERHLQLCKDATDACIDRMVELEVRKRLNDHTASVLRGVMEKLPELFTRKDDGLSFLENVTAILTAEIQKLEKPNQ